MLSAVSDRKQRQASWSLFCVTSFSLLLARPSRSPPASPLLPLPPPPSSSLSPPLPPLHLPYPRLLPPCPPSASLPYSPPIPVPSLLALPSPIAVPSILVTHPLPPPLLSLCPYVIVSRKVCYVLGGCPVTRVNCQCSKRTFPK